MGLKQEFSTEIEEVRSVVETVMNIDIMDRKRNHNIVEARMIFSLILRNKGYKYAAIAKYLNRDHTTIMYYCLSVKDLIHVDKNVLSHYTKCKDLLLIKEDSLNLENNQEYLIENLDILKSKVKVLEHEKRELEDRYEQLLKDFNFDKKSRLIKVFKFIDENTPEGREQVIYRRIKKVFNG